MQWNRLSFNGTVTFCRIVAIAESSLFLALTSSLLAFSSSEATFSEATVSERSFIDKNLWFKQFSYCRLHVHGFRTRSSWCLLLPSLPLRFSCCLPRKSVCISMFSPGGELPGSQNLSTARVSSFCVSFCQHSDEIGIVDLRGLFEL